MRRLDLDFQRGRRTGPLGWTLLLCGVLLAGLVLLQRQEIAVETASRERELHRLERLLQRDGDAWAPLSAAESRAQDATLAEMRRVSAQMNLPWGQLFGTLEAIRMEDVALLSLAPDARKRKLRISAEARSLEAMLEFHRRLEQSDNLSDVSLLNHEVLAQEPERPVRFNLLATWEVKDVHP